MSFKTDVLAAKKEALYKHPSAASLKADIEEVWVQHRGMREPQDAGDATHVPRPWPALDKRCKAVVSTAMRSLLMPEVEAVPNMTFFLREIRLLEPEQRLGALEELLRTFAEDFKKLLSKPHIAAGLDIALLRLDIESATELWLSLNIRHRQWDALAKALNALLPAGKKFSSGLVPCTDSMKAWLRVHADMWLEYVVAVRRRRRGHAGTLCMSHVVGTQLLLLWWNIQASFCCRPFTWMLHKASSCVLPC
jgi:hypothetical protein